jgi:putative iron-dependent peroxidase
MLRNMFIGNPPGNHDRILDFSTAVTGTLFFVPSADLLDALPDPPGTNACEPAPREAGSGAGDDSLGIGDLRAEPPTACAS